jgi:hypothetical protein
VEGVTVIVTVSVAGVACTVEVTSTTAGTVFNSWVVGFSAVCWLVAPCSVSELQATANRIERNTALFVKMASFDWHINIHIKECFF